MQVSVPIQHGHAGMMNNEGACYHEAVVLGNVAVPTEYGITPLSGLRGTTHNKASLAGSFWEVFLNIKLVTTPLADTLLCIFIMGQTQYWVVFLVWKCT